MEYTRYTKIAAPALFLAAAAGLAFLFKKKPRLDVHQTVVHANKKLVLLFGDAALTTARVLILDNNSTLNFSSSVARHILNTAGPRLDRECQNWVLKFGKLIPGECATTKAGSLTAEFIVHVVPPHSADPDLLAGAIRNALETAVNGINTKSVALTEVGWRQEFDAREYSRVVVQECKSALERTSVEEIQIVCADTSLGEAISQHLS